MAHRLIFWSLLITCSGSLLHAFQPEQPAVQRRSDEDSNFEIFLYTKLEHYNMWLALNDPLPPTAESVELKSTKEQDKGVDANFTISNYYMSGHSKSYVNAFYFVSDLNYEGGKSLDITETFMYRDMVLVFGGDYTANGTIQEVLGAPASIPFYGNGTWRLEVNSCIQILTFYNYSITDDDYVDLDTSLDNNYKYGLLVPWNKTEFDGLTLVTNKSQSWRSLSQNSAEVDELKNRIQLALANTYGRFLNTVYQHPIEQQPLKMMLVEYLKDMFTQTKYSDIIAGRATVTSTPPPSNFSIRLTCNCFTVFISYLLSGFLYKRRYQVT